MVLRLCLGPACVVAGAAASSQLIPLCGPGSWPCFCLSGPERGWFVCCCLREQSVTRGRCAPHLEVDENTSEPGAPSQFRSPGCLAEARGPAVCWCRLPAVPRRRGCASLCSGTCMGGSLAKRWERTPVLQEAPDSRTYSPVLDPAEKFPKLKSEMTQPGGSPASRKEKGGLDDNQHALGSDPALGPELTAWHQLTSSSDHPGVHALSCHFSRRKWTFRQLEPGPKPHSDWARLVSPQSA